VIGRTDDDSIDIGSGDDLPKMLLTDVGDLANANTGDGVSASGPVTVNTTGKTSTSGNLKAGSYTGIESVGTALSGADASNYTFAGATGNYTVSPRAITVAATGTNKVYDGTVSDSATLTGSGVINGDLVSLNDTSATFADKNVGNGKTVSVSGISASGADGSNYVIGNTAVTTTANITPATLTYVADPTSIIASQTATGLQGSVSGFVSGDTLANATTGTLTWFTTATPGSSPGQYAIDGSGLSATNYVFIQAASNATALTLSPSTAPQLVIDEVALLDESLSSSKPASVKSNDLARAFSLRVVDGGVRLPDNGLSAKP